MSKTKHSASIGLSQTGARKDAAERACPHWDYEGFGDMLHDCCYDLQEAEAAHRAQLKRWRKEQAGG